MFGWRRAQVRSLEKRMAALEARVHMLEAGPSNVKQALTPSTLLRYWGAEPRTRDEVTGYGGYPSRPGFAPRKYSDPPRKFGKTNRPDPRPYQFGGVEWGDPETPTIASKSYLKGREPRGE